jgi:hypothetical protein
VPYDLAAVGASVSGRVGTVVRIRVGLKNLGPGAAAPPPSQFGYKLARGFVVEPPPGVTVVGTPEGCTRQPLTPFPTGPYGCHLPFPSDPLASGESLLLVLDLRIDTMPTGVGSVRLFYIGWGLVPVPPNPDTNQTNDTASIVISEVTVDEGLADTGIGIEPMIGAGVGSIVIGGLLLVLAHRRTGRAKTAQRTTADH